MGPLSHFIWAFILVMGSASALGIEPTLPVWIIAVFGGLFPDFTHEKWEFIGAALISFGAAYIFGLNNSGDVATGFIAGAIAILILLYFKGKYTMHPGYKEVSRLQFKKEWYSSKGALLSLEYIAVFALAAFFLSGSWEIGLLAAIAYASHSIADWVWYGTDFGVRHLARIDI